MPTVHLPPGNDLKAAGFGVVQAVGVAGADGGPNAHDAGPKQRQRVFQQDALQAIAEAACLANEAGEDIGARRLHAVFEELLEDISFNAGGDEMPDVYLNITADYVREHLNDIMLTTDTHRYIL